MKTVNHECYVDLEVANLLKEAGFNWKVQSYYSKLSRKQGRLLWLACGCLYKENININQNRYSAPTLEVAQRWLREVKDTIIDVNSSYLPKGYGVSYCVHWKEPNKMMQAIEKSETSSFYKMFSTYEEAQEAGIKKVLEIILEKRE